MPRRTDINQYYTLGIERNTSAHRMIERGAAGQTGADFIKMLVEDVDRLMRGEPAVVLTGLLASAKISLQTITGGMPSNDTTLPPAAPVIQNSALSRAARARKSYTMDDDEDEEE
jgi:hypothetical protein